MATAPAAAHPAPFSFLDLRLQPGAIDAALVVHVLDLGFDLQVDDADRFLDPVFAASQQARIADLVSRRLSLSVNGRPVPVGWGGIEVVPDAHAVRLRARIALDAPVATAAVAGVLFPYDPQHRTFINVYEGDALTQAIVDHGRSRFEYFAGTRQGVAAVVGRFVPAGVHHILIGPDHVLFLVGLLLLGGSLKRLALIVTGFTLAHSVTLSLAALGIFTPPAGIIEPAIALSIIYVGVDNLLVREGRDLRAWIAFGFGFVHGFGFANVLQEMDLPVRALGWSLFSFNLGVEIGQLAIVAVVATAFSMVRARSETVGRWLTIGGSIAVIAAGTYWFAERTIFTGGLG
ncbi:MAG TPA: HupE/UreJ family protein [Vicinamibacterales bacterium]|nr:HupE/UreJ family protein [Vicinamibacterales bacterium]